MKTLLIVGAVGVLVAGCGQKAAPGNSAPSGTDPAKDISGQVFVSQAVTENGQPRALADGTQITLELTDKRELRVRAGCNHIFAPADTSGGRLSTADLRRTDMGCDKARMDQDDWLAAVIDSKPAWEFDGTTLRLKSANTEIVFTAKQPTALEGTPWVVNTVVENTSAKPPAAPALLTLDHGTVLVTTPCNSLEGRYQATTEKITFHDVKSTDAACPQADEVLPVIDGELGYKVDGETLTFTHSSGKGLQFSVGSLDRNLADKQFASDDGRTVLTFKDGVVAATVGCNDMSGPAVTVNGKLIVQRPARTLKACEPALMEQEDQMMTFLTSSPEVLFDQTGLRLKSGQTELAFRQR
ncbi:META domain-containing protein [Kibdelosporangium persicum]|uniref:Heat shock protein HslJ n=1 Tax=Kibdelosporangium persicum TaxID=2698649 RepID=A0ABX2F0I5_9PSEU|nr:META domain-containing protein [Kibdelosporangium persicum]NRN64782.1 Heat shock protein HslJ [Kibdelosporangium persicum]